MSPLSLSLSLSAVCVVRLASIIMNLKGHKTQALYVMGDHFFFFSLVFDACASMDMLHSKVHTIKKLNK